MQPFEVSMGKGAKMRKRKRSRSSKTCRQTHPFTQADYRTEDRCRIPDKADSKERDTDSHTVITLILEGQGPQKQIPPLHTNHF